MRRSAALLAVLGAFVAFGPGPAAAAGGPQTFIYVLDRGDPVQVFGFHWSPSEGLVALPGSPFASPDTGGGCGGLCQPMAYSPKRKMLFTGGPDGVTPWTVAVDGTLTPVAGAPFGGAGGDYLGTGVWQSGKRTFVYSNAYSDDAVHAFEVQPDGTLVELDDSPYPVGCGPDGLDIRRNLLFVANESDTTISSFVIREDGTLVSSGDPTPVGTSFTYNVNADPKGKFLYADGCDGTVAAFAVDRRTAALTPLDGSPFAGGVPNACSGVAVSKKLVVQPSPAEVTVFARAKDGSLTTVGTPQGTGTNAVDVAMFDARGKMLLLAGDGTPAVRLFSVDRAGILTLLDSEDAAAGNVNMALFVKR